MKEEHKSWRPPSENETIVNVMFTKSELKEYYKTIRNDPKISDSYKLRIANAILDA